MNLIIDIGNTIAKMAVFDGERIVEVVYDSNLGMIVKRNSLNKLWIAVSNILDTKPMEKAKVTVYNFQLQVIGTGETNSEGFTEITPQGVPFIVVTEVEKQKAYVRVADGEEQSVSRFDVLPKVLQTLYDLLSTSFE